MTSLEIPAGSEKHAKILREINDRYEFSRQHMEQRYDKWRKAEEQYLAYIPSKEIDAKRKRDAENGKPSFVTLTIPYSYAVLLTAHTYWTSVFMARTPIFQYTARHGAAEMKTQAIEALIDYQLMVGKLLPSLFVWLLDMGKYGVGIVGNYWDEEKVTVARMADVPTTFYGVPVPGKTKKVKQTVEIDGYKGNKLFNVRPYDFFPDPRVSMNDIQKGEFCGRVTNLGWNEILRRKARGTYFNTDKVKEMMSAAADERERGSSQIVLPARQGEGGVPRQKSLDDVQILEMVIELIPNEWDLGTGSMPEKWAFTVVDKKLIIGAQPLGLYHNKFPYMVLEYEVDGYSFLSRGMMEVVEPLQTVMDWLFNSHMYAVRRTVNNQFVVDPSRLVMADFQSDDPGRLLRLKPTAYGTDIRTVIQQLQTADITRGHINDAQYVGDMIQRVLGVTDNVMGMVNPGGRKTATEVRTSSSFSVNRLKTGSEYHSATGWSDLAQMLVQNTQQFYDEEQQFKVAGDTVATAGFIKVNPEMISGFFDFVPVDGTLPIDKFALANLWKEILFSLPKIPPLMAQYDISKIFSWTARLSGLKNIDQMKIQVVPDGAAQLAVQQGNLIPAGGPGGQGGAVGGGEGGIPGAPITPGMGPVA